MVRGEPLDLVGVARPYIDFLVAEDQRCPGRLALARVEHLDLHAEDFSVPFGGARHVRDIDHEMIERVDFERHGLSFGRGSMCICRTWPYHSLFVTTRSDRQFNTNEPDFRSG